MGCLHDPANVQQTFSKCIQNTCANAGRLLDRVNTLFWWCISRRLLWLCAFRSLAIFVFSPTQQCI